MDSRTQTPETQLERAALEREPPGQTSVGSATAHEVTPNVTEQLESLLDSFEASVRQHPDRTLFLTKSEGRWQEVTYRRFHALVADVRGALHGLGVVEGDRVGIIAKNGVPWATVAYACYGLRAALVPMYETQLARDWAYILADAGITVLFVGDEEIRAKVETFRASIPTLEHVIVLEGAPSGASYEALLCAGATAKRAAERPAPGTVAALLYTSGTTGDPKGVLLTHGNIWSNVLALKQVALDEERPELHRTLSFLPWAHAFGHTVELHLVIAIGASMAIAEGIDKVADNLLEVRPTVLVAVPRVFIRIYFGVQKLLESKPRLLSWVFWRGIAIAQQRALGLRLSRVERALLFLADRLLFANIRARFGGRLRFAISGAAALPLEVARFVAALGVTLCEGYGLTETSPIVSANVPGKSRLGSVGRPLPGVRVVIDSSLGPDPESGEIIVYGPNVMTGYYKRERESREAFTQDGGLRTGDLGYLDDDGYLHITGRIKEQYKLTNGKYVVPSVLESAIERSRFVSEAMVYGNGKPYNVALIVLSHDALRDWASERGLAELDPEQVCSDPSVLELLSGEIARLCADQRGYERIKEFRLLARSFSQEDGLLTPSLKLRRHKVVERFRAELDELYARSSGAAPRAEQEGQLL